MEPRKPATRLVRISGAGKWITVSVTTVAAIIGILVNARNLGLTPWLNVGSISFADLAARRVLLNPPMDTLDAIGDTVHLAATVTDEHGATLAGATIVWSTDDSAVAVVDSAGGVIARGPGTATIGAAVREHNARARVTVWQRVRSVAIAHDTVLRLPEGATVQLVARALDARGHAVVGRTVRWQSADSGIVQIDPVGSAAAAAPGRTTLTASTDGYTASMPAEVALTAESFKLGGGDEQRAAAGRRLPQPVQIQVFSRGGRPVPDVVVSFAPQDAEASANPETATTDRNGRARTSWTLGPHAGRQHLMVTVGGVDTSVVLVAEADPVPANTRTQLAREITPGPAGARLPDSVGIRVTDQGGAAVADVPVAWTSVDGQVAAIASRTDSVGEAWAYWTLGPRAGTQRARVQVGNPRTMPAFTVTATALAEDAAAAVLVSGSGQEGRVGEALRKPIVVRLTDRNGNAVAGAGVRISAFDGGVPDSVAVSDASGLAHVAWTLGPKAGAQSLEFSAGDGKPLKVTARALPLDPANLTVSSAPVSAAAGRPLAKPIAVTLTDAYGNNISNVQLTFSVSGGSTAPVRVMTDARGQASTRWTLGPGIGDQFLTAGVRGNGVKTTVTVKAIKTTSKK